jgi:hypothetical protein
MVQSDTQPDPKSLSTILALNDPNRREWSDRDLGDMVRHQLAAPLYLSLGTLSAEVSNEIQNSGGQVNPRITLGQLLAEQKPPVELLKLVKRFAKLCRSDPESPLPGEIVMLLYYASITVALVRLGEAISHLNGPSLRRGLSWLIAQAWIPPEIREFLKECFQAVK